MNDNKHKLEVTTNVQTFYKQLDEKAKFLAERGPVIHRDIDLRCDEGNDKYWRVQNLYASARAIQIHDLLRSDVYSEEEKVEMIKPYLGALYTPDEELTHVLRSSKDIDLFEDLLMEDKYQTELEQSNRDFYFQILHECANLMIDEDIGRVCDESGYSEISEEISTERFERKKKYDESVRELMKDIDWSQEIKSDNSKVHVDD